MSQKPPKPTLVELETLNVLHSGFSRLADISNALGLSSSATNDRLKRCRMKGFVETIKGGRDWRVTPEGIAALENAAKNPSSVKAVKPPRESLEGSDTLLESVQNEPRALEPENWQGLQALAGWSNLMSVLPLPEFRAALRLVLAVALLRNRAPKISQMPWIGLYGATGTGKSTVAMCARAIVGGHFFQVGTMTAGEAIGRRSRTTPYKLEVAPRTLAGAVTDLDELAEAPEMLRTALYALMQRTDGFVTIEGQELENRAAIVATWNPDGQTVPLPAGALRRGLLMDTTPFKARLEKAFSLEMIGVDIRAALEQHSEPWVKIQNIPEPVNAETTALEQARRTLYSLLKTPSDHPLAALSGLGAAYATLFCISIENALVEVVADMASLAATRGATKSDWREILKAQYGNAPETSELETPQTDTAALVRYDLELTKQKALIVTRAANAREPLRKHYSSLQPNEREIAAPLLAALEAIGQGAPHANPERLEALNNELNTLENQALSLAQMVKARLEHSKWAVLEAKQAKAQMLEDAKQLRRQNKEKVAQYRKTARALQKAAKAKDSPVDSVRAKYRAQIIEQCKKYGWLETRRPEQIDTSTEHSTIARLAKGLANFLNSTQWETFDTKTQCRVYDIDAWMLQKAKAFEDAALMLEGKKTSALPSAQNARALPISVSINNFTI